jgi:hypothetical protein
MGSVLGNPDLVVGCCACGLELLPLAAIPSHKHSGPHCLVGTLATRQEGRGFVPVCGGQLGSGAGGTQ